MLQGPGGVQALEGWKIAANHVLSRVNDRPYQMVMEEERMDSTMVV